MYHLMQHINVSDYNFSQPHRFQYTDTVWDLLPKNITEDVLDMTGDPTTHTMYMLATRYLSH